jgi:hypothetical protein
MVGEQHHLAPIDDVVLPMLRKSLAERCAVAVMQSDDIDANESVSDG